MKMNEFREKIRGYDWKKLLSGRNFIILGCVLLIAIGVTVTSALSGNGADKGLEAGTESGTKILGNTVLVGGDASAAEKETEAEADSYFAVTVINRQRVRDEAMEVLREVADNPDVMPDVKENALASISSITKEMNAEANIESLVKAKGFAECVAVISGDNCSVIVRTDGLLADEVAQILEIVLESTSLSAENVHVVPKND